MRTTTHPLVHARPPRFALTHLLLAVGPPPRPPGEPPGAPAAPEAGATEPDRGAPPAAGPAPDADAGLDGTTDGVLHRLPLVAGLAA